MLKMRLRFGWLLLAAGSVHAADYAVSPQGSDGANGSPATPWKTLQKAADSVQAGDTVTVADGTYAGFQCDGKAGTAAARIVFRAEHPRGAKITSAGVGADSQDYVQLNSCSYVTVDGFEVSGAPRSGIAILGNQFTGADSRDDLITNCYSHHNGGTSATGRHDGIFSGFALNLTIENNEISVTGEHGIYVSNAADNPIIRGNRVSDTGSNCIQINADLSTGGDGLISGWLIENNVVSGCKGSAAFNLDGAVSGVMRNNLAYGFAKGGITLFQGDGAQASHDNVLVNNTLVGPTATRAALQVADGADNNVIFNNILISADVGLEIQTVSGLFHDHNVISSVTGGTLSANEFAATTASLFVAPGSDHHLAPGSAALNAGVATFHQGAAPNVDLEGTTRPQGGEFDLGAYERSEGGPPSDAGAGPVDAGQPGVDASVPFDAGRPKGDAGSGTDASVPGFDAGPPPPPVDAGVGPPTSDAGGNARADAGVDAGMGSLGAEAGCGCATAGWPAGLAWWALVVVVAAFSRSHFGVSPRSCPRRSDPDDRF